MGPAALIVGDNPGLFNYGDNENCFEKAGLMKAAKGYYQNIGNDSQKVPFNADYMPWISIVAGSRLNSAPGLWLAALLIVLM